MGKETARFYRTENDNKGILVELDSHQEIDKTTSIIEELKRSVQNITFKTDELKGESKVERVNVSIIGENGNKKNVGGMILKTIYEDIYEECVECGVENMRKKYRMLRELGIPVPSTFRIDDSGRRYLMNDLTCNGRYVIMDKHLPLEREAVSNIGEIRSEALVIAEKTFKAGLRFDFDAYSIVVDKRSHIGSLVALDFGSQTYIVDRDSRYYKEIRAINISCVEQFFQFAIRR